MGVTLVAASHESTQFKLNWWCWRPIVAQLERSQVLDLKKIELLSFNSATFVSQAETVKIATVLKGVLATQSSHEMRLRLDGTSTFEPDDGTFHRIETEKNYSVPHSVLQDFIDFCDRAGGFTLY